MEAGVHFKNFCTQAGICDATFYHRRVVNRGVAVNEARPLHPLEEAHRRRCSCAKIRIGRLGSRWAHRGPRFSMTVNVALRPKLARKSKGERLLRNRTARICLALLPPSGDLASFECSQK